MRVSMFVTCVVDLFAPDAGLAAARVLSAAGCSVSCPSGQTCCGQPAWNSGFAHEAARVARTSLEALEADGADAVVVPAGSCATMIKVFWPEMFELDGDHHAADRARALGERTYELTSFLAERELPALALASPTTVAYHHSCHMLRELDITTAPVELLDQVEGCSRVEWGAEQRCCGFGGLFSFKLPEASVAMADEKLTSIAESGATMVVGADSSCLLHLRSRAEHDGRPIVTRHIAEILDQAITEAGGR